MLADTITVISWNITRWVQQSEAQVAALGSVRPDIVALQEVREGAREELTRRLAKIGLPFWRSTASSESPDTTQTVTVACSPADR
ncbi:MAG: hypothetical protein RLZZ387_82 [Chloroflexota bacterium]|jgi:exonuclease III